MEGVFTDMGEIPFNPHLIVSKGLRLVGLSNHPFTAYQASMDLMLRHRNQMPLNRFVTHRFPLEKTQAAIDKDWGGHLIQPKETLTRRNAWVWGKAKENVLHKIYTARAGGKSFQVDTQLVYKRFE